MADGGIQLIEVRAGNSPRTLMELKPGSSVNPTSVGRTGMWNIDAPGILDVHAYVYFDGQALFVQSADPSNPAKGNGQAISTSWQQMEIPCTIELGKARLVYRTLETLDDDDNDKTQARPLGNLPPQHSPGGVPAPPKFQPGVGAFAHRADDESTRFQPMNNAPAPPPRGGLGEPEPTIVAPLSMDDTQQPGQGYSKPLPAAGQPAQSWGGSGMPAPPQQQYQGYGSVQVQSNNMPMQNNMQMQGQNMQMQGQNMPMQGMQGPQMPQQGGAMQQGMPPMPGMQADTQKIQTPPTNLVERMKKDWNETSPMKRALLLMMPLLFVAVVMLQHHQEEVDQAAADAEEERLDALSASAAKSIEKPPDTAPTQAYTPPIVYTGPTGVIPTGIAPTAMTGIAPTAIVPPVPTPAPTPTVSVKALPANTKTTERLAVDAVAGGDYKTAAALYDQLVMAVPPTDPRHDTYVEAARIMHIKASIPQAN